MDAPQEGEGEGGRGKRPRFETMSVKKSSETPLSSFADLSRKGLEPKPIRAERVEFDIGGLDFPTKTSISKKEKENEKESSEENTDSILAENGQDLSPQWTCLSLLKITSATPFSWFEKISERDREIAVGRATTVKHATSETGLQDPIASFEQARISFSHPSLDLKANQDAKSLWKSIASGLLIQLQHSITPYFYAIGSKNNVLFLAASTHPTCSSLAAIITNVSAGLRSTLEREGYITSNTAEKSSKQPSSELSALAKIPGIEVRTPAAEDQLQTTSIETLYGDQAIRLLSSELLAFPMLVSPRPFVGCQISRAKVTTSDIVSGFEKSYCMRIGGPLLPTQSISLFNAVKAIHPTQVSKS